jgi:hypothetical protein
VLVRDYATKEDFSCSNANQQADFSYKGQENRFCRVLVFVYLASCGRYGIDNKSNAGQARFALRIAKSNQPAYVSLVYCRTVINNRAQWVNEKRDES